jgi:hypothetical protein
MENQITENRSPRLKDWLVSLALAGVAAIVYSLSAVDCAAPGFESGVIASWLGLDVRDYNPFGLAGFFARMFGVSAFLAPLLGVLLALCAYHIVNIYLRQTFGPHFSEAR